jgi:predicted ATP-grasp superfamily ATP-dependent carboligase
MDRDSTPVTILKSSNYYGLGILRSLGRLGIPIHVMSDDPHAPAFLSSYCRTSYLCHIADFTEDSLRDLLDIGSKIGRRSILIATTDDGAIFVADHADALNQWFMFPNQRADLVHSLCSKKEMYYLAKKFGVPTAETVFPESREDVLDFVKDAVFPIMLKPIHSRRGHCLAVASTERELIEKYDAMEDPEEPNIMLQEYIPGGDDTIWMFNGYFNERSDCLVGFTGKKIRQWPAHQGPTSLGICLRNEYVERMTREFMKRIGYRGILDIGYRYDARDAQYKVLDINPRIGATFRLFVADNGMDVARALYFDMTGQRINPGFASNGRKWFVEDLDFLSSLRSHREGNLSLKQWIGSFRGVREGAYFALDDPLPFLQAFVNGVRALHLQSLDVT